MSTAAVRSQRTRRRIRPTFVAVLAVLAASQVLIAPTPAWAGVSYVGRLNDRGVATLHEPGSVTADNLGNIFVADTAAHRIVKFSPGGEPLLIFGQGSSATAGQPGHLYYPEGITFANGHIYVADTSGDDVQVFTTGGTFVKKWGTPGSGDGQFSYPTGIGRDCQGNIYVTDGRNQDVQEFDGNGTFLRLFGLGDLAVPNGVVASTESTGSDCLFPGGIYVSDEYDGRIAMYDRMFHFVKYIGKPGHGPLQFDHPEQLAIDYVPGTSRIHMWVAESSNARIQELTSSNDGATWAYEGEITQGAQNLSDPHGVAVDEQGRIIVVDAGLSEGYVYKDVAPQLTLDGSKHDTRGFIASSKGLFFEVKYNQLEKKCSVLVTATLTVPPGRSHVFTVEHHGTVGTNTELLKLDLSSEQVHWLQQAWAKKYSVTGIARASGSCSDNVHVRDELSFRI